jgi:hypothetical protein
MFQEISYAPIFGRPLIMYLGIITFSSFLFTASIAILNFRGIRKIPFLWHPRFAGLSICLGIIHGSLGILAYI